MNKRDESTSLDYILFNKNKNVKIYNQWPIILSFQFSHFPISFHLKWGNGSDRMSSSYLSVPHWTHPSRVWHICQITNLWPVTACVVLTISSLSSIYTRILRLNWSPQIETFADLNLLRFRSFNRSVCAKESKMSSSDEDLPNDWIPYAERPEWGDVVPLKQDDGENAVVTINYSEKCKLQLNVMPMAVEAYRLFILILLQSKMSTTIFGRFYRDKRNRYVHLNWRKMHYAWMRPIIRCGNIGESIDILRLGDFDGNCCLSFIVVRYWKRLASICMKKWNTQKK